MFAEKIGKRMLVVFLLVFSFMYRFLLMTMHTFPPGADIGLHESVVNSITVAEPNFFVNYYHMGGGVSATNPGYHVFLVFFGALTGAPDYLAHSMVAAFFSTIMVLCVLLVVRRVWSEPAAFIAAFLAAFSSSDISMLSWGGYPNIIALLLIPVVFYLFLRQSSFSLKVYLVTTSLLVAAMFLTHVFSALIFVAITVFTLFVSTVFSKWTQLSIRQAVSWLAPIVFGALLVSPYLFAIVPVYFGSEGTITGAVVETKQNLLATRLIPLEVVCLSFVPVFLFFVLSKRFNGKYLTIHAVLSAAWILVPAAMTQSYLLGVYLDYERFIYFLFVPVIIFTALLIESGSRAFSKIVCQVYNLITGIAAKTKLEWVRFRAATVSFHSFVYSAIVLCLLFLSLFSTPIFAAPNRGFDDAGYYQLMTSPKYDAIQWIKTNTPTNAVLVASAEYGWWLSGFAQRPTLSGANPKFLILAREIEPAEIARNLLRTDYFIDNGFMQVNYYRSHVDGNSFEVATMLNGSDILHPVLSIRDTDINVLYRNNDTAQHLNIEQSSITKMQIINGTNWASFQITAENQELVLTESITIYTGVRFAKVTINLQSKVEGISFDWLHVPFMSRGAPTQYGNSIGFVDSSVYGISQMIFPENQLGNKVFMQENPNTFKLVGSLDGESTAQMEFFTGFYQYQPSEDPQNSYVHELMANNAKTYLDSVSNLPLEFFDYQKAIDAWNISHVVVTDLESVPRFAFDPAFSIVYKSGEVAVFRVN